MIDSYKNFERLRYRLSKDLGDIKESIDKNSSTWYEEMLTQMSSATISALIAGAITTSEFNSVKNYFVDFLKKHIKKETLIIVLGWTISIIVFLLIYVLIFLFFKFLLKLIKRHNRNKKIYEQAKEDFQKKFDNIACDSIYVAIEYRTAYMDNLTNRNISNNLKTFYFYEVLHYLKKACDTTRDLCSYKNAYIKTDRNANGVEIYRIYNMIELIKELLEFTNEQKQNIASSEKNKLIVSKKLQEIEYTLKNISNCMETLEHDEK